MIKLLTRAERIASVPQRWFNQSQRSPMADKHEITRKLLAMQAAGTLDRAAVDATIGNGSWTEMKCDECGVDSDFLVRIGQEPDYDNRWVDLCEKCLAAAMATAKEA